MKISWISTCSPEEHFVAHANEVNGIHIALRTNKACILAKRAKPMKIVYPSYQ